MSQNEEMEQQKHPIVSEHPEQRRQDETGHEDASEVSEVGQPPSKSQTQSQNAKKSEHAA